MFDFEISENDLLEFCNLYEQRPIVTNSGGMGAITASTTNLATTITNTLVWDNSPSALFDYSSYYEESDLAISDGSLIRVIRGLYFGRVGKVKSLPPELAKMESETLVRVAEIEFENGPVELIPRANLEMILT